MKLYSMNISRRIALIAKSFKQIILQPISSVPALRKFLLKNGFKISNEYIVFENNIYSFIIEAENGNEEYTEAEYLFGKKLIESKNRDFQEIILLEAERKKRLKAKIMSVKPDADESIAKINAWLELAEVAATCSRHLTPDGD